jgi:succinate dehydrogenase / fumarate reductase, flavoprotein subunit
MPETDLLETPILIIGAGAAGLSVAIALAERDVPCLVLGKRAHGDAHTVMAAGGINASLGSRDPEDRWEIHAADTLREGHFVCDPTAVELLARHAPDRIRELQRWGCEFSRTERGEIDQRYFGAQSFRRTCFVGDRTGEAILETLVARAKALDVAYRQNVLVTGILVEGGRAGGALGVDLENGRIVIIRAGAVVIAAGGYTSCYLRSSSRAGENNGDAVALAMAAGCTLQDMEFVQFHPTGMVAPEEMAGRLITEAVRGEGGHLLNRDGERFMERYAPEAMELDARDVVARAIYREIREGRGTERGGVLLDVSHRDAGFLRERLPKMVDRFGDLGIDISKEPMEVAPTAHYAMGGIRVDFATGATGVPGLYAVGEATAGVHGANRLGGNSLAETVVFGRITGEHLAEQDLPLPDLPEDALRQRIDAFARRGAGEDDPAPLAGELRRLLWDHAGIVRDEATLREGLAALDDLRRRADALRVPAPLHEGPFEQLFDLRCMLLAAECILRGALARDESRGAHFRDDHPDESDTWRQNLHYVRAPDGTIRLSRHDARPPSEPVRRALDEGHHMDYHHLE